MGETPSRPGQILPIRFESIVRTRRQFLRDGSLAIGAAVAARNGLFRDQLATYIHCTDLYRQYGDPDDTFDLACLHALRAPDLIVLDQAGLQAEHPGRIPAAQMDHITGRNTPIVLGAPSRLISQDDQSSGEGVAAIVSALRSSRGPVRITVVGWATDVAAAFNREPELFRRKAEVLIFAGDAQPFEEHNARRDPLAFLQVMTSGAQVRWIPCFDGGLWVNDGRSSYVSIPQADLFPDDLPPRLVRFFSYFFSKTTEDPIAYLDQPVTDEDWDLLHSEMRNLWAGPLLGLTDQPTFRLNGTVVAGFESVKVEFTRGGLVEGRFDTRVDRFRIVRPDLYAEAMTAATVRLFRGVPAPSGGGPPYGRGITVSRTRSKVPVPPVTRA
jgi:hypothetical protein